VRGLGEARQVLDAAQEVRVLDDHRRGVGGDLGQGRRAVGRQRQRVDLHGDAARVRVEHLAVARVQRPAHQQPRAARGAHREQAGLGGCRRTVVERGVGDVEPGQLADQRLELEDRLQRALAHLGLVRRVGSQELAATGERVDHRRDEVVVRAGAEKAGPALGRGVLLRQPAQPLQQRLLAHGTGQTQGSGLAQPLRNRVEQIRDLGDADLPQHGGDLRGGV
jgi:hypothetical protein